ncbi:MAG: PilZ domain-containing protein [Deltaproteobacteria bacterium]|nr:PilZ domain-containing protein [Deltaproteobacteria bacterium]
MENRHFARAKIKWPVSMSTDNRSTDGVTLNLSPNGAYIGCANPLRLNEVFDVTIDVPNSGSSIQATVEVVFSNIYGPDDAISPRGMGVRFLKISSQGRQIIAKEILQHLRADKVKIDSRALQSLETLVIEPNANG